MKKTVNNVYAIPETANIIVIIVCSILYFVLLNAASNSGSFGGMVAYGFLFAFIMIPVYSLIHEAEHNILHGNQRVNNLLGRWLCAMFIVSFSFFKHCHLRHHKKNRTDIEIWELYFEHQVKWKRYGNLYLMMVGCAYLSLWISVIFFAIAPSMIFGKFFKSHTEIAGFLEGIHQREKIAVMRWESIFVILFQLAVVFFFHLHFTAWLILYLIHGFVWSSQNYVNHAFSPRDIINGAHNLKMPVWLKPIYLNFNVHLAHHQNPRIPWIYLPHFINKGPHRIGFFRNYLRLWKGPRLTHEKNPTPLETAEE